MVATGSEFFFSPERLGGGGFQKMVLRKFVQINTLKMPLFFKQELFLSVFFAYICM